MPRAPRPVDALERASRWASAAEPALVVVGVMAFYAVYVTSRIQKHSVLWFVHLGHRFLTASTTSDVITPSLGWQSKLGYDGQYYFALAADPAHAHDYMGDKAGYIYARAFYPALSRAASLGSQGALPYAMLAVNLASVALGTLAVALWLRRRGAPVWPAALFGLYPGLVFSVFRDLTEPLAFALAASAVLVFDSRVRHRLAISAVIFALALLTRETVAPFALAAAAALVAEDRGRGGWRSARVWRRGVLFALAACAPLVVWRAVVTAYLHLPTQETGHDSGWAVPFHGILSYRPFDDEHRLIVWTIVLPTLASLLGAVVLLVARRAQIVAVLLIVNALLYVVFLPETVDIDYDAAARAAIGVVLASLYCVPAWWRGGGRVLVGVGAFTWSILWYLAVASHLGVPGMPLIAQ